MSNYIVLVKQVPDVSQITDNAFNPETGTLIRSRLANVINELDAQAVAYAKRMISISGDDKAKIVALTMGPPMAEDVLRYSLARCADTAVLLTDRKLGGADTWATANPLAFAVRRIVKEIFNGDNDFYIVCGMQSVDGDTAQVPPQMAAELDIPCVAYATDVEYEQGKFHFHRIISGGSQVICPVSKPAIITVAKYEYPLFAQFARMRQASKMQVLTWSAEDIGASGIGVEGSKTRVIRVFPPGKTTRKCQQITDVKTFAELIVQSYKSGSSEQLEQGSNRYIMPALRKNKFDRSFEGTEKENNDFEILQKKLAELNITDISSIDDNTKQALIDASNGSFHKKALDDMLEGLMNTKPVYSGDVWVMAEHTGDNIHPATFELISKARELADSLNVKVGVVIIGDKVSHLAESLIFAGADNIYTFENAILKQYDPKATAKVVSQIVAEYNPQIMLYAATPQGRVLAPMISYSLNCGLTADCTSLDIKDSSRKGLIAVLMQTRPALGGNVMATICTKDSNCQMATARSGVFKRVPGDSSRKGNVIKCQAQVSQSDISLEVLSTEYASGSVDFESKIIISGGKGLQSKDNYDRLMNLLIESVSNKLQAKVEKGASRAAVEQGFIDRAHQVGQTGTSIGPKIYIALGISGAIQHMIGVANTETIFSINMDTQAPIFKQCDYYMTASIEKVVPELVREIEKVMITEK